MNLLVSTIICTYNRKDLLSKTIESVINQSLNKSDYEIIVVDNNSTDGTRELIEKEYKVFSNIRYILETKQGISNSRNTGWKNSYGKYIAYIDDDETADHFWLESLLKAMQKTPGMIGAIGGKVELIWESRPPNWLSDELSVYLSTVNLSEKPILINIKQSIGSGNAMYPKEILYKMGGFDTDLKSRVGRSLISGEDTLLHKRIMLSGYNILYDPRAVVKHLVHSERVSRKWLIKRYFWAGYSISYIDQCLLNEFEGRSVLLHNTEQLISKSYKIILNMALTILSPIFKNKTPFLYLCRMLKNLGYIYKIFIR